MGTGTHWAIIDSTLVPVPSVPLLRFPELWENESNLGGSERAGFTGEEALQTGVGEEPSAELGPGWEGQEIRKVTLGKCGTVEWGGVTGLFVVHKEKEFNGLNMFDLHCKYTTFFWHDQIFAASGAYNSIKVDKTRYNSMTSLFHVVTLHREKSTITN